VKQSRDSRKPEALPHDLRRRRSDEAIKR